MDDEITSYSDEINAIKYTPGPRRKAPERRFDRSHSYRMFGLVFIYKLES